MRTFFGFFLIFKKKNNRESRFYRAKIKLQKQKKLFDVVRFAYYNYSSIKDLVTGTGSFLTSLPVGEDNGR